MACVTQSVTTFGYQTCSQCGQSLQFAGDAKTVRCNECYTINPARFQTSLHDSVSRVQDQFKKTSGLVKGYMQKLSSINSTSTTSQYSSYSYNSSSSMHSDHRVSPNGNHRGGTYSYGTTASPHERHGYGKANTFGTSSAHHGTAQHGTPHYGTPHYGTAHHETAHHETDHHGTAHHGATTANAHAYGSSGSTHDGVAQTQYSHGGSPKYSHHGVEHTTTQYSHGNGKLGQTQYSHGNGKLGQTQYSHGNGKLGQTQYSHGSPLFPQHGTTALSTHYSTHGSSQQTAHEGATVPHSYGQVNTHLQDGHHQNSYGSYTLSHNPACPPVHGKKRAVLCGVSYKYKRYELKGTVNDVNCMKYLLRDKFGFSDECIIVLTEDDRNPTRVPTKQNIRNALRWLVHGSQSGDSLFFHYSGHGSQQVDVSGDEADGYDEAICPMDYETEGTIVDDEINETIVRPLPKGAKLHAIVDACHSGTILDLPFVCKMNRAGFYDWLNESPSCTYKGTKGGLAISFSSCDDNQTSADTSAFSINTTTGAMTYCFIQAVESQPGVTYGRLLNVMRSSIREAQANIRTSGPIASLLKKMLRTGFTQEPQLCASERFDVYKLPFQL
ncbi:hypothetical protein H6P81_011450 [Aristolochia fimbriata]|uniref:Peptidase C14 caspase domain-containing protein n=1 Tax=Aristolochia fimbriata TaxID=158543 RepID=A0AAV7ERJ6_ARIFI|nr:hypothetical protein H6P81_011450 [Aristolochia fimbriata]